VIISATALSCNVMQQNSDTTPAAWVYMYMMLNVIMNE